VLVQQRKRGKSPQNTPIVTSSAQEMSTEESPAALLPAKPDHSRVPSPAKRLLSAKEMMEYWHSVPEPERSAWFTAYVYRKYPFCDVYQPFSKEELLVFQGNKGKKRIPWNGKILERPDSNCGTLKQPLDPENWERQVYERWGAGDYQIRLNDQHESIHETVTECHIRGLRDWDRYPPVLELNTVVLTHEDNQPYIRWARLKGIKFPGDAGTEQEAREEQEIEMTSVVETMARQNEALTDKVVRMAETSQQKNGTAPVDPASRGQLGAVETVVEGAKQAMGVMGGAMKQMMENQVKAADPEQHVRSAIEMAKLMQPPAGNGNSDLLAIMKLQLDQQEKNAQRSLEQQEKSFTRLIDMQRESHQATVAMLTGRLDSLEKQKSETPASSEENALKTYQRIRSIFRDMEEEEAPANDGPAWLGPVLSLGEKAISGIAETTRNLAAMRNNQSPMATVQDPAQGLPPAPPPPETPQDKEMNMQREYAKMVHRPLVDAIKAGRMGYEFAAGLISEAGQPAYDALVANGYDGLTRFLQGYPPLWNELTLPPIGGVATDKFLREFLDRAKVMDAMQMVKGQPVRKGPTINQ
jgi:hypothetical protein